MIEKKHCLNCNKIIIINYDNSKKSWYNYTRKKYCSLKCKKEYLKKQGGRTGVKINCKICGKSFYVPKCLSKKRKLCSNYCRIKLNLAMMLKRFPRQNKKCDCCGKKFITNKSKRKYCSIECSNKGRQQRMEITCEICGKKIMIRNSKKKQKYCSKQCLNAAQSCGIISSYRKARTGFRKDLGNIYFKSSLEADYCRFLKYKKIKFEYEKTTFKFILNGKIKYYTPDYFLIEEKKYIELKGFYKTNLSSLKKIKKLGIKIEILESRDFYRFLKKNGFDKKIKNIEGYNYEKTKNLVFKKIGRNKGRGCRFIDKTQS